MRQPATIPRRNGRAGIALLEMLVALLLLALAASLLTVAIRLGLTASERVRVHAGGLGERRAGDMLLRDLLVRAEPLARPGASSIAFEGEHDRLAFAAAGDADHPGLARYSLAIERDGSQSVLMLARCALGADGRACAETPMKRALLLGVTALVVDYYGARVPGESPVWRETWREAGELPSLVRLSLRPATGWPDLVVSPMQSARRP
ncbi:MAG: hypothetical protein EXQ87_11155 [Alphaproteobacteria bacterium]|nr:hypothetical protein [Alphaproteobacteria bacterium]